MADFGSKAEGLRWSVVGALLALSWGSAYFRNKDTAPGVGALRSAEGPSPAPSTERTEPVLKVIPAFLGFGDVSAGQSCSRSAVLENHGLERIRLLDPQLPCGCLGAALDTRDIPPGASGTLTLTYQSIAGSKPVDYSIRIPLDGPGRFQAELRMSARTRPVLALTPEVLNLGTLPKGTSRTLETIVRRLDGAPFRIRQAKAHRKDLSVALEARDSGTSWGITVTCPSLHPGWINDSVSILLSDDPNPAGFLTVTGEVSSDVEISPRPVTAARDSQDHVAPIRVRLRRRTPGEVTVVSVSETRGLPLAFDAASAGDGSCDLTIRFIAPFEREPFGELLIRTTAEEEPLSLPYRIERKAGNR